MTRPKLHPKLHPKLQRTVSLLLVLSAISAPLAARSDSQAANPCEAQLEAKHAARIALTDCIEKWAKDRIPAAADPSDDCSAKLSGFTSAAKTFKACIGQVKAQQKKS